MPEPKEAASKAREMLGLLGFLLVAAKAKGASVMTGRDLAVYQAADAFELFTGLKPPVDVIQNAFDAVMASRYPAV